MKQILAILNALNDRSRSLLLCQGSLWGPRYVNDKAGPKITPKTFRILLGCQLIKPLARINKEHEGPWFAISDEGRRLIMNHADSGSFRYHTK